MTNELESMRRKLQSYALHLAKSHGKAAKFPSHFSKKLTIPATPTISERCDIT